MTQSQSQGAGRETLESLYIINKHAKKYAELGTENYEAGKKTTAKANSVKKGALYSVKEQVIAALLGATDKVERHVIDGRSFYCVYFGDWSFHIPEENLSINESRITAEKTLDDFESGKEKERSDRSLKESLLHLESVFGVNANEYLEEPYLWYGSNRHFVGWSYLGDGE